MVLVGADSYGRRRHRDCPAPNFDRSRSQHHRCRSALSQCPTEKAGVRHLFPDELVIELADQCSQTAAMSAKMRGDSQMTAKTEMVDFLNSQVDGIGMWLRGEGLVKQQKAFVAVMEEYGIPFGVVRK